MAEPLDFAFLNDCAMRLSQPGPDQQRAADTLKDVSAREDFWQYTDQVLENDKLHPQLKFLVLQSLRNTIETRWGIINEEMKSPIRDYVMKTVIAWADLGDQIPAYLLSEIDLVLVQILFVNGRRCFRISFSSSLNMQSLVFRRVKIT